MTQEDMQAARQALSAPRYEIIPMKGVDARLAHLPPEATVTVTCSPSKGIAATLELSEKLATRVRRVVPHLSARLVSSRAQLKEILARLEGAGIRDVFVVGGDRQEPLGPYPSSLALARAMGELGYELDIGVTAYPEGHPLIADEVLRQDLQDKLPVASYMTTQLCFDPATIARWLAGVRAAGISLPVTIGIPGAVGLRKLSEIALRVGVGDSLRFLSKHGSAVGKLLTGYRPDDLIAALAPHLTRPECNILGFHIYTFNQLEGTEVWRQSVLSQLSARVEGPATVESAA